VSFAVITDTLYRVKRGVREGGVRVVLQKTGLLSFGRAVYNRLLLRQGIAEREICGQKLRFAVHDKFEITEIDGMFEEDEFIRRILDSLQQDDILYDVGANIGIVALAAAKRAGANDVRVLAFEPEPNNVQRLRQNIELNQLGGAIDVQACGLGRAPGRAELHLAEGDYSGGSHSIGPQEGRATSNGNGATKSVWIELDSVDHRASAGAVLPTVMKIDVEGAEMEVLLGAETLLRQQRVRELFIEVHIGRIFTDGFDPQRLQAWLEARGYRLAWSQPRGTEIHQHYRA
jgi:FkbM family methyltransferase